MKTAIIIGGGIGGLHTAALLGKEGYRVTVLEKHVQAGGGLHTFRRGNLEFETGIHCISGLQEGGTLRQLYTYLGIFGQLRYKLLDEIAFDTLYIKNEQVRYAVGRGKKHFMEEWSRRFPESADEIRRYTEALYAVAEKFYLCNMRLPHPEDQTLFEDEDVIRPVGDFIAHYISHPRLRQLMAYNNALYAGEHDTTPAYVHAIVSRFYIEGAARFVGGSRQLADALCGLIGQQEGEVVTREEVRHIEVENKEVRYIETAAGRRYAADLYISAIHPSATVRLIDASQLSKAYRQRMMNLKNSYSSFILYVTFKPDSFPYLNTNLYCIDDADDVWKLADCPFDRWPLGLMAMSSPDTTGNELYTRKLIINSPMKYDVFRPYETSFHGHRPDGYKALKKACEARLLRSFLRYFPQAEGCIESYFSATPLTIRDFTGSPEGSLYGIVKDVRSLELSHTAPHTKIRNLFLTGQNINLHGILGTPLNALITVAAVTGGIEPLIKKIQQVNN